MLVILGVLLAIKSIVLPPSGDAEAFYMVLPKILADSHRLVPQPNYISFSQIGLSGEMHFAALISLASPYAAKFFVWIEAIALATLVVAISSSLGCTLRGKITALVILLTSTTVTFYIYDGKVDLFGATFGLAAYYWILQSRNFNGRFPYVMTGIFLSFAMIAKFSNIPVIIPGILLILFWNTNFRKDTIIHSTKELFKNLMIVAGCSFIFLIPHLLKNFMLFSEPLAPFYFFKANGNSWIDQAWYSPEATKFILKTYPLALVFGRYPMQGGTLSALILAFFPLILVLPRGIVLKERQLIQIASVAVLGVGIWMLTRPSVLAPRYILSTLLLFIPVSAWLVEKIYASEKRLLLVKFSITFSMLVFLLLTFLQLDVRNSLAGAFHWFGNKSSDYKATGGIEYLNTHTHTGDRIYFVGYYTYLLRPDLLQCISNSEENPVNGMDIDYLFDHGYKYYIRDKSIKSVSKDSFHSEDSESWLSFTKVFDDTNYVIYNIFSIDSTKTPDYSCKQCGSKAWSVFKQD
jgi:hypothetical protein